MCKRGGAELRLESASRGLRAVSRRFALITLPPPPPPPGRHGSRHATKLKAPRRFTAALREASALGQLTPLGVTALTWVSEYTAEEFEHLGELTPAGHAEHAGTSLRLYQRHAREFDAAISAGRPLVFEATAKTRTMLSRDSFAETMRGVMGYTVNGSRGMLGAGAATALFVFPPPPTCPVRGGDAMSFSKLRFFESCTAYTDYKEANRGRRVSRASLPTRRARARTKRDCFGSSVYPGLSHF